MTTTLRTRAFSARSLRAIDILQTRKRGSPLEQPREEILDETARPRLITDERGGTPGLQSSFNSRYVDCRDRESSFRVDEVTSACTFLSDDIFSSIH